MSLFTLFWVERQLNEVNWGFKSPASREKKRKIMRQMRADLAAWCMIFDGFQETITFNNFLQFIPLKEPLKDTKRDPSACRIAASMLCCRHCWQEVFLRAAQARASPHLSVHLDVKRVRFHHCLQELGTLRSQQSWFQFSSRSRCCSWQTSGPSQIWYQQSQAHFSTTNTRTDGLRR